MWRRSKLAAQAAGLCVRARVCVCVCVPPGPSKSTPLDWPPELRDRAEGSRVSPLARKCTACVCALVICFHGVARSLSKTQTLLRNHRRHHRRVSNLRHNQIVITHLSVTSVSPCRQRKALSSMCTAFFVPPGLEPCVKKPRKAFKLHRLFVTSSAFVHYSIGFLKNDYFFFLPIGSVATHSPPQCLCRWLPLN